MKLDEIGFWSEVKLEIIRKYAAAYCKILKESPFLRYSYIDAFAGAGIHKSKKTGDFVLGSPFNALNIDPKFEHYYFIDKNVEKVEFLQRNIGERPDVTIYTGDCNEILPTRVFPNVKYKNYKRALCFLDPYGLHLKWEIIHTAGQMKSVEIFLNFPVLDMNRNVLLRNPDLVEESQLARMNAYCGGDWWKDYVYEKRPSLFEDAIQIKSGIDRLVVAFQKRLRSAAGFKYVPNPLPMCGNTNAVLYYIFFATQNETANKIVDHIFNKYRRAGMV